MSSVSPQEGYPKLPYQHTSLYKMMPKRKRHGVRVNGQVTAVSVMGPRGVLPHRATCLPGESATAISFLPPMPGDYTVFYTTSSNIKCHFDIPVYE